jgi:hypothetical protein
LFFSKLIDLRVPKDLDVHLVLDNLNTHSHEKVANWLAPKAAPVPPALPPDFVVVAEPQVEIDRQGPPETSRVDRVTKSGMHH